MDKDGNEVAANGLYSYFDENGTYKGGLYKYADSENPSIKNLTEMSAADVNLMVEKTEKELRIQQQLKARFVILIWHLKWLSILMLTSFLRQVSLCLHRLISLTKAYLAFLDNSVQQKYFRNYIPTIREKAIAKAIALFIQAHSCFAFQASYIALQS